MKKLSTLLAKFYCLSILLASAAHASAQDAEFSVKPVKYSFTLPAIEELPDGFKPMGADKTGCEVAFAIAGDGLIYIERGSIKIDSIVDQNGNDVSENEEGFGSWKTEHFPKASNDGKFALFSVFVATEKPMVMPRIAGSVKVNSAGRTRTQRIAFKTDGSSGTQKAGDLAFAVADESRFAIAMSGKESLVTDIAVEAADGTTFAKEGYLFTPQKATYFFPRPDAEEFELVVTYYVDVKETEVAFGK
jgi:hypothetical protein